MLHVASCELHVTCWELLHPLAHHCQHGRNSSQHFWSNNVGSCRVRVQNKAARLLSLPLLSKSKMATTRGKIRRNNYIAVSNRSLPASHSIIVIDNAVEKMYACSFFPEQTCFSKSKRSTVMLHLFRFWLFSCCLGPGPGFLPNRWDILRSAKDESLLTWLFCLTCHANTSDKF